MLTEIDKIDVFDRKILLLKYKCRHLSLAEIGEILGISKQAIHQRIEKSEIKKIIEDLDKDTISKIKELHLDAIDVLKETLKSNDQKLRFQAAKEILSHVLTSPATMPNVAENITLEFVYE